MRGRQLPAYQNPTGTLSIFAASAVEEPIPEHLKVMVRRLEDARSLSSSPAQGADDEQK
jgi:hypothetical protein